MAVQQGIEQARTQPMGRVRLSKLARREEREFYLFISLWIVGFILFDAGPIVASLGISFTDWSVLTSPKWIGTANYRHMFADPLFYKALWNSIYYGVASVGLGVIVSFLLALLLNQKVYGMALFRTIARSALLH